MTLKIALLAILSVFLVNMLIMFTPLSTYYFVDIPVHFLGGLTCAMLAAVLLKKTGSQNPQWFNLLFSIGFVMLISVGWELTELFSLHFYVPAELTEVMTVRDTLSDFVNAGIGAIVGWYSFIRKSV